MILVTLPAHLRELAHVTGPVALQVEEPVTQRSILDALEAAYPMLRGTIRDAATKERRAFIRFFACGDRYFSCASRRLCAARSRGRQAALSHHRCTGRRVSHTVGTVACRLEPVETK